MKTIKFISGSLIIASAVMVLTAPAYAQDASTTTAPDAQPATSSQTSLKQRVEKRKAELKTKLTTAQQTKLQTRCKNAQGKLQSVTQKTTAAQQNRVKIYGKLLDNVAAIQPKLTAAGVSTVNLDASSIELKAAIEIFKTSSAAYEQAVKDTAELDCQADPVAFQASLTDARTALQKVRTDAGVIRTITNQKVKPALVAAKSAIAETKAE